MSTATPTTKSAKSGIGGAPEPAAPAARAARDRWTTVAIAAPALVLLVATALSTAPAARADTASVGAGAQLYKDKCVGCHGADGSGSTPMGKALKVQDIRKPEIQAKKDAELAAAIANGKGKMPPQKGNLSAAQIGEIVTYIRTLAKK